MFLKTQHLILRKHREEDFQDFCEYAMDPELCRMTGCEEIQNLAAARDSFHRLMSKERSYAIVHLEDHKAIGYLTIGDLPYCIADLPVFAGKTGRTLSFSLSRLYRRRGLMSEAVSAVIGRLFAVEDMDYVNCGYFSFNTPSRGLQEKLGFTYLATNRVCLGGREVTAIDNVLWREQWSGSVPAPEKSRSHT